MDVRGVCLLTMPASGGAAADPPTAGVGCEPSRTPTAVMCCECGRHTAMHVRVCDHVGWHH